MTKDDLNYFKDSGYNSVRIPFNWRLFVKDDKIDDNAEGFKLLDKVIDEANEVGLYVILDMHAAPGGQTGANIDDSIDDVPRLFMDKNYFNLGIDLWEAIAERYANNPTVAGYDILNEPIRPALPGMVDYDYMVSDLSNFYTQSINKIRSVDKKHIVFLEGHHWDTATDVVYKKYDDNEVVEFHRYGIIPQYSGIKDFLQLSEDINVPIWLGETGESLPKWNAPLTKLCEDYNISYHFWPFKKMEQDNGMLTFKKPGHWDDVLNYTHGDFKPNRKDVQEMLNEILESVQFKNCSKNSNVDNEILRKVPFDIRATDFNENNDKEPAFHGNQGNNIFTYRLNSGIEIFEKNKFTKKAYPFDVGWDRFAVKLHKTEYITFTFNNEEGLRREINIKLLSGNSNLKVYENGILVKSSFDKNTDEIKAEMVTGANISLKLECSDDEIDIDEVDFI